MTTISNLICATLLLASPGMARAAEVADVFTGRYGHQASEPAYQPVWEVRGDAQGWQAGALAEGDFLHAHRMSPSGRRAFWEKMDWPIETAVAADCVTWGDAPPTLLEILQDTPEALPADTFGNALICHVPAPARQAIGWLADSASDWFYYDPMVGVMEVRQLR